MPDPNLPARRRIHPSIPFIASLFVLLYLGLNAWIYFDGTKLFNFNLNLKRAATTVSIIKQQGGTHFSVATPTPTRIPKRIYPLPTGTQSWKFSGGNDATVPKIHTATIDPLTPAKGGTQTVTITAKHDSLITAAATLATDNKSRPPATMKLTAGSQTDGTWQVSWSMDDTYDYMYHIDFVLTSATGTWEGGLTFR